MFKINADLSIEITRGDAVEFTVTAKDNGENYVFQVGDIVRFKVFEKKGCECVVLQKDFAVETANEEVTIQLTEADTKIGDLINKPKDYWYEVELNPDTYPQTIIGYNEDGAKVFKLYPEGRDLGSDPITPDDIPFVDKELDMTSDNPVENQAIAKEFAVVKEEMKNKLPYSGGTMAGNLNMGGKKLTGLANPVNNTDAVTLGYANNTYALKSYVESNLHRYHGTYAGDIDRTDINGLYWLVTANCSGTFPTVKYTYSFLDATETYQKLIGYTDNGIGRIEERYYTNSKWYPWKRTDGLDSLPLGGGTMSGAIAMDGNKITGLGAPTADAHAVNLGYANSNYAPKSHTENKSNPHGVTASQVGARPDTWMPTASDVGAAPSGFGLGTVGSTSVDSVFNIVKNGWWFSKGDTPDGGYWYCIPRVVNSGNNVVIDAQSYNGQYNAKITKGTSGWGEWEWVNPPMEIGIEYRTTERHGGKPVYCKCVNYGSGANNTTKTVEHGISNVANVIEWHCYNYNSGTNVEQATSVTAISVTQTSINMTTKSNEAAWYLYFIIKYTKTTD